MKTMKSLRRINFDEAVLNPGAIFTAPEEILDHDEFSRQQKIHILQQWQYDASSVAVAEEEGMEKDGELILQRVLQTLHRLTGGVDVEHTGPTKQSGLSS